MSKDRARPFSRKHRKYWIPVTGGMILLGLINVVIGYCSYSAPTDPQRIELIIPKSKIGAPPERIESSGSAGARSDAKRRGESIESSGSAGARSDAKRRGESIDAGADATPR